MTTINPTDPRLTAFVLGELSAEEAAEIQTALDQSVELQTEAAAIREIAAQIENAMLEENMNRARSGSSGDSDAGATAPGSVNVRRWLIPAAITAVAASFVAALALPLILNTEPGTAEKPHVDMIVNYAAPEGKEIDAEEQAIGDYSPSMSVPPAKTEPQTMAQPWGSLPTSEASPAYSPPHTAYSFGRRGSVSDGMMGMGASGMPAPARTEGLPPAQMPAADVPAEMQYFSLGMGVRRDNVPELLAEQRNNRRYVQIAPPIAEVPAFASERPRPRDPYNDARAEAYKEFTENDFLPVKLGEFSTFAIDVDTASYATMRRYVKDMNQRPPVESVRLEEYLNYFTYDYAQPEGDKPFATHVEVFPCPWQPEHLLARIGIKGKEYAAEERPPLNLVFLVDVSGSMAPANRLPLVKQGLTELVEKLQPKDRVAIVTYANNTALALPSVSAQEKRAIIDTINGLRASGGTYGESGIKLAYDTARRYFDKEAQNRVILCTDGDFNIGTTDNKTLEEMIAEEAKSGVFLTILGFGMGNIKDDRLKTLSMRGNGNYGYIDSIDECRKLLVEGLSSTLFTIAKDVKIQVDFNPAHVAGYRLLGYENRRLRDEDFHNDAVDAGDIGAGHTVTALYELVPVGVRMPQSVDSSRYDNDNVNRARSGSSGDSDAGATAPGSVEFPDELMFVKLRYKEPDGERSTLLEYPVKKDVKEASGDSQFASAVALYGMLLRSSRHSGNGSWDMILELASPNTKEDKYREEFIELVCKAAELR